MQPSSPTSPRKLPKGRGCLTIAGKGLLVIFLILVFLIPFGWVFQSSALQEDQRQYPPPGIMVDVGDYQLHLYCVGEGSPTVVFEAGLGDSSFIWNRLQTELASKTRVCTYDRPGLGWSDFAPELIPRQSVAENLYTLLTNAGIEGPFLLAGHSIGGIYIREFAYRHPEEVAGLVFIDSVHEQQSLSAEGGREGMTGTLNGLLSLCRLVAPTGVFRAFGLAEALVRDTGINPQVQAAAIATLNRNTYCQTIANELQTSDDDTRQPQGPQNLGSIPVRVLVAGRGFADGGGPPGMSDDQRRESDETWLRLQDELANTSTNGKRIIADQSGHYIHLDQPELVIETIMELVNGMR